MDPNECEGPLVLQMNIAEAQMYAFAVGREFLERLSDLADALDRAPDAGLGADGEAVARSMRGTAQMLAMHVWRDLAFLTPEQHAEAMAADTTAMVDEVTRGEQPL